MPDLFNALEDYERDSYHIVFLLGGGDTSSMKAPVAWGSTFPSQEVWLVELKRSNSTCGTRLQF